MTSIDRFRRTVASLDGMLYRLDKGLNEGRNAASTDATIDYRFKQASEILRAAALDDADPLPEWLDSHPRFAAKWARIERRVVFGAGCA